VDSTLLSKIAYDVLGDKALAAIGVSASYPKREENEAIQLAQDIGIPFITIVTEEMEVEGYRLNRGNRCYFCKKELYSKLQQIQDQYQFSYILDGTNYSDLSDDRPGIQATEELNIKKPLVEAQLTKDDIRLLSKQLKLSTWDKPTFACLSSRFPTGTEITTAGLILVDKGENILYRLGFLQFRLRLHHDLARIELLEKDFAKIIHPKTRTEIIKEFQQLGFQHITLDLVEYGKKMENNYNKP